MMANNGLNGVIAPCLTPFYEDGEVNEAALELIIEFLADKVDGISVCAIYGSGILMRPEQRQRVAEIAVKVIKRRCKLSVFVGAPDTDTSLLLTTHAQKIGADAITCVEPIYYKQVDDALFLHFKTLIDATDLPVYLYDSPEFAGNFVTIDLLQRLADYGLKGAITGAAIQGIEYIWTVMRRIAHDNFDVISIRDGLALPAMMNGAVGFESGVANFFPELTKAFHELIIQGNYKEAMVLQNRLHRLRDVSHGFGRNVPTLHALVSMRGLETGVPKKPFYLLSDDEVEKLWEDLNTLDFDLPLEKTA